MNELGTIGTYQEFKKALDMELYNQAGGFVRTGYLLKVARDTDILRESGYSTVAEFAQAEYGLTKDVVSRYISINDRYSEGGYSDKLQEKYQKYGVAKLQEMLTLPDAIIEIMSPEMTRKEIQEVKREYRETEENPMESLLEEKKSEYEELTMLQQAMYSHLHDNPGEFTKSFVKAMQNECEKEEAINGVLDALSPSGVGIKTVKIQGIGKVMISFRGKDADIELLVVRTQERASYTWENLIRELREILAAAAGESEVEAWERIYEEPYKKAEVAPVQPKEEAPATVNEEPVAVEKETEETEEEPGEQEEENETVEEPETCINTECEADCETEIVSESEIEVVEGPESRINTKADSHTESLIKEKKLIISKAVTRIMGDVHRKNWSIVAKQAEKIKRAAEEIMKLEENDG